MSRHLTDWLRAYLSYMSHSEAPEHFHFWSGVAALAGALRRKIYIDQIYFRWSPNFYIILVAPSGIATKSVAMSNAMDLLKELPSIHFGPNAMTWQAILPDLARAQEQVLMPEGDYETQSCLTFASSEFGTLLDPSDRKFLDVLVDLWDGKTDAWRKATATMGEDVATNPWLNIIACTTPSWIADNLPRHVIGGGFTSRCLFVYGDKKRQLVPYPKKMATLRAGLPQLKKLREDLIHDLELISCLAGEYELTTEAEEFGEVWYKKLYTTASKDLITNHFDGYLSRKQSHVHKLAMVLSAAHSDELIITKTDLEKAILLVEALEVDMTKVFRHISIDATGAKLGEVIQLIHTHRQITRPMLYRMAFTRYTMQKKEFDEIINSAIDAGLIKTGPNLMLYSNLAEETRVHSDETAAHSDEPVASPFPAGDDSSA